MKPNWKPIAIAPKDGTTILVAMKGALEPALVFWSERYCQWIPAEYEDLDTALEVCGADWVLRCGPEGWPVTHWDYCPEMP